ncbi:MAG: PEGA domain-containing protein, partial [Woeseiaceae bacterium]|nr:PEGA domain-containing protein [Woeseiaceae bacterium]
MSFDHLFVRDVEGERRIDAGELPLRIGTGSDCAIRLPGPGGGPVILFDLLDGEPFVQPVGRDDSVTVNGDALTASRRLADGDEIEFYGSRIGVLSADERLELRVQLEDSAYVTQPPEQADADAVAAEEAIAPTAFRRAAETRAVAPPQKGHPLRWILGAGLSLLAVASWLLFTSRSVQISVLPEEPDSIAIDGGWFHLPLGDRILMRPGEYTLRVEKAGYYDVSQAFEVGDDEQTKTVAVTMRKLPGKLTVRTVPQADVTVSVNDAHIGPAPLGPLELQPGDHSVRVESARFLPFNDVIEFPGLGLERTLNVQLVPRWAEVTVTSEPPGATVYAGEQELGVTPAVVELFEGSHNLSVVREGFKAWDGSVTVQPNVAVSLPLIELEEADARLRVNTIPRGANVMVNGRYRGQSPLTLDLVPDIDYQIGLSKAGYGSTTRQVRLASGASESISVDLSARTGTVTVDVSPSAASVFVAGRQSGRGSTTLRQSSTPHRIEVRKPGYETWSRTVTPRPGYPQKLSARLRSEEAVARSKLDQVV